MKVASGRSSCNFEAARQTAGDQNERLPNGSHVSSGAICSCSHGHCRRHVVGGPAVFPPFQEVLAAVWRPFVQATMDSELVARTCSEGRGLFVMMGRRTADLQNRSALHVAEQPSWPYSALLGDVQPLTPQQSPLRKWERPLCLFKKPQARHSSVKSRVE